MACSEVVQLDRFVSNIDIEAISGPHLVGRNDVWGANSYSTHISDGFPSLVIRDTLITIAR